MDLISKKTRNILVNYLSGSVLAEIHDECRAADMAPDLTYQPDPPAGQRRTLAMQYMHALDFSRTSDARKFLRLCESQLSEAPRDSIFAHELPKWLLKDGFKVMADGSIVSVAPHLSALSGVREMASAFDAEHMHKQIERINASVDADPALAIGSAKELIETCCKTILRERGKDAGNSENIIELVKLTRAELKLLPDDVPNASKGADSIKRLLSNLGTIAQNLGEIRSLYGTGHGQEGRARGLKPRHARLAVNSAAALTVFLYETHKEQTDKRA